MTRLEIPIGDAPGAVLYAELLRDGRVALGTRAVAADGNPAAGEMLLLEPGAYLALGAWLSGPIADAWIGPVRERQDEQLRTAEDLYGRGRDGALRLATEVLREMPAAALVRALLLLLNAIGPAEHERLVARLNAAPPGPEDDELRRRLADQREAFAYAVAAAALLDAVDRGLADDE